MTDKEFLDIMDSGEVISGGSPVHLKMHEVSRRALRITNDLRV